MNKKLLSFKSLSFILFGANLAELEAKYNIPVCIRVCLYSISSKKDITYIKETGKKNNQGITCFMNTYDLWHKNKNKNIKQINKTNKT